jgi:hypothetical protein
MPTQHSQLTYQDGALAHQIQEEVYAPPSDPEDDEFDLDELLEAEA